MGFAPSTMQLTSTAIEYHKPIPDKHTGVAENTSPALAWTDAPKGTQGFAIICHDPDAPLVTPKGMYGFVHWVLYNIPASIDSLEEGTVRFTTGVNDAGKPGYTGPLPPPGHGKHHYYFWVLALGKETNLPPGLSLWELLKAIEPDVLGMNRLIGTYKRT